MKSMLSHLWYDLVEITQRKYRIVFLEELPTNLAEKTAYVVGESDYRWYVAMLCPCGCGEAIYLNVRPDSHPYWRIIEHIGTISIEPSIWRQKGCRSHFFLRKGRIRWVREVKSSDRRH